jgi:sulfite reductase alpha subunit-like flavoprotein
MGAGKSVIYNPTPSSNESIDTGGAMNAEKLDVVAEPFADENQTSRRVSQLNFSSRKQLEGYGGIVTSKTALVGNGVPCGDDDNGDSEKIVRCLKLDSTTLASSPDAAETIDTNLIPKVKKKYRATAKQFLSYYEVPIIEYRNLCQATEKYSTFHLELDISHLNIEYEVADAIQIMPENPIEEAEAIAKLFELNLDDSYDFQGDLEDFLYPFPSPFTVKKALTCYLDLMVS